MYNFWSRHKSLGHVDNKKKYILVLSEGPTQELEKKCSINFTESNKKFCLRLHCNRSNSYLFVNGTEIIEFKAKDSEIVATPLCLRNVSKDFSVYNIKKTELKSVFCSNDIFWLQCIKCKSIKMCFSNQECKIRLKIISVNSDKPSSLQY